MRKRFNLALMGTLAYFLCIATPTSARQHSLTLLTEHLPPHQFYNDSRKINGYIVDIVSAVMENENIPFALKIYPWARSYSLTQKKENTCLFSTARTATRESQFKWVYPLINVQTLMWGLNTDDIHIDHIEEAKAYTVAAIRGGVAHSLLLDKGFVEQENLYIVDSTQSIIRLLYTRPEIHFIIADDSTIKYKALNANVPFESLKRVAAINEKPINLYLACNLNTPDQTIDKIRHGFNELKASGQLKQINNKWRAQMGKNLMTYSPHHFNDNN